MNNQLVTCPVETVRDAWEFQVAQRPDQEFLVHETSYTGQVTTFTYAQMDREVRKLAVLLQNQGVQKADQILLYMGNTSEFVTAMLAIALLGAVAVPVDETSSPHEFNRISSLCTAQKVMVDHTTLAVLPELDFSQIDTLLVFSYTQLEAFTLPATTAIFTCLEVMPALPSLDPAQLRMPTLAGSDLYELLFTSGTTAEPKGVMITQRNVVESGNFVVWELALGAADRYATSMVSTRVNFQLSAFAPVLLAGATLIMFSHYSASRFWKQLQRHKATVVQGMALIVSTLLRQVVASDEQEHNLRIMHYFLPLSDTEKQAFEQRFRVKLLNNYGSTETLVGVITDYSHGNEKWPSVGRVGPGYTAKLVTPDGEIVSSGEVGELWIKGEPGVTLMAGYWNNESATAEVLTPDGWYRTGDYMYSVDGWYYFVDRRTDLIKRNGETVSSAEVESVISQLPEVLEVAVVGVPDVVRGQAICAVVVLAADKEISEARIIEHCAQYLAPFKVPSEVVFRTQLPRGAYGKVNKAALVAGIENLFDNGNSVDN